MLRTSKPLIAGWLEIAAGIIWFLVLIFLIVIILGLSVGFGTTQGFHWLRISLLFTGIALPAILAMLGGIFSITRKSWVMALIGSICAVPLQHTETTRGDDEEEE